MPTFSQPSQLGSAPKGFSLRGVDGKHYTLEQFNEAKALVIVFMCNHCPYVLATLDRINALAKKTLSKGVQFVGINANDSIKYPDDSFEKMQNLAKDKDLVFPYLHDETQDVARSYDAVCTPEFYAFGKGNGQFTLQYHGRLDDNWKDPSAVAQKDLEQALEAIVEGRKASQDQKPAVGCSIKWKD